MALLHNLQIEIGSKQVNFDNAYIRVVEYEGDKSEMMLLVSWSESASGSKLKQAVYKCPVNLDGENPMRQAYLYLKTLPEFAEATDC
jgi:hypothetical protein